ncbi:MAG: winged helix-turn-helix domain-containing protein [Candidatus Scalindua sp.]
MEFATQIEVTADIIWIRLHANGEMMLRRLRSLLRMEKSLFYQGIGWLAREGKIYVTKEGWRTRISLVK